MRFPTDETLEHLREQADLLAALLQQEAGCPVTLEPRRFAAGDVPDVGGYGAAAWIVAEGTTLALLLPAEVCPTEWDGVAECPPDLADRLAAAALPETTEYRPPRMTDVIEAASAIVPETVALLLPSAESDVPVVLLVGLHNPSAVERVGDSRLRTLPVKVVVTLAEKRIDVGQLLAISPGTMIPFSKPCEELLDLYVNNHRHARGEAVKIGEKFGLKISRIGVHDQRVSPVLPPARG